MDKPVTGWTVPTAAVKMPARRWHGFTFPSNPVTGSAAQFNCGVSIMPPHHILGEIDAHLRRHDGYTASS